MIDENSRNLIERAAAHLRSRGPAQAAAAMPMPEEWPEEQVEPEMEMELEPAPPPRLRRPAPAMLRAAAESRGPAPVNRRPAARGPGPVAAFPQEVPPPTSQQRRGPALSPQPVARQVTIDRAALARFGIVIPSSQRSRIVEEFRIVKRQVVAKYVAEAGNGDVGHRNRVIMVTSARPGEGKTFAAINLALSIASEQDLKVLLIDLDTKNHAVQEMMGFSSDLGLMDLLSDPTIDFPDVVLRTNMPNLSLIPAGNANIRVPELLSSNRTRDMLNEMSQRYSDRFIIFDAPSCLGSSDPAILAGLVGQTIFVVEADHTQQSEVESAINLISGCPNINLLLNKIRASATDQFGSYSDY